MSKVVVDWSKFIEAQTQLDSHIFTSKSCTYPTTQEARKLALIVELHELINESKVFKFWSTAEANKEKLLLEYIDLLHFTLSLSIDYQISLPSSTFSPEKSKDKNFLLNLFIKLSAEVSSLITKSNFLIWFEQFIAIGSYLGFSFEEINNAYFKKLEINYQRQKEHY